MTNEEFYKDELEEVLINALAIDKDTRKPINCSDISCNICMFGDLCVKEAREWLKSEHVESEQKVDWSKVKVDTPIYVRSREDNPWVPRYFARYENGKVYAWNDGKTSFTAEDIFDWSYAKLAESEEK